MQTISKAETTEHSKLLFEEALRCIPGGVNSPVRAFRAVDDLPRFIHSAKGAKITDVDGSSYIDYVGSWGPMILGHANKAVIQAVLEACQRGLSFGAPCPAEVALAAEICRQMPNLQKVRMVNSGTEATMTAIRLARAATGRAKIVKFAGCYHGHADSLLVQAGSGALTFGEPSSPGVPKSVSEDTLVATFNDLDSVLQLFSKWGQDIAAIIVEPIACNMNVVLPIENFLSGLRDVCDQYKSLLIFDEVITGFRVDSGGAQNLFDIKPDLTTLGKIIGGGMPVGAVGGSTELMDQLSPEGPVYQAGTLSGNPISMAAGLATLTQLQNSMCYQTLNALTRQLVVGLSDRAKQAKIPLVINYCTGLLGLLFTDEVAVNSYAHIMACNQKHFVQFFKGMLAAGIYLAPSPYEATFISLAHGEEDIAKTLAAAEQVFSKMR